MRFDFIGYPDEKEVTFNIDTLLKQVDLYTSNNTIAQRVYKRLGKPNHFDEFGANWIFSLKDITKIPMNIFKVGRM
jgi:hypothetical protein